MIDDRSEDGRLSIVGGSSGSSLRIGPVKGYDAALYTCRAFNLEDSIDGDATLTVQGVLALLDLRRFVPLPRVCPTDP